MVLKMKKFHLLSFLLFLAALPQLRSQEARPLIYQINIKENISSNTWFTFKTGCMKPG